MSVAETLSELDIVLPKLPAPAAYVATARAGDVLFTAGQIAISPDGLLATGRVGAEVDVVTARACARLCMLNVLAQVNDALGDLDRVARVVKLTVFVASAEDFTAQPAVADAASELLVAVLGEVGAHARSAVGVAALPLGSPVEIEAIVEVAT